MLPEGISRVAQSAFPAPQPHFQYWLGLSLQVSARWVTMERRRLGKKAIMLTREREYCLQVPNVKLIFLTYNFASLSPKNRPVSLSPDDLHMELGNLPEPIRLIQGRIN